MSEGRASEEGKASRLALVREQDHEEDDVLERRLFDKRDELRIDRLDAGLDIVLLSYAPIGPQPGKPVNFSRFEERNRRRPGEGRRLSCYRPKV